MSSINPPRKVKLLHDHQYNVLIKEGAKFTYDKLRDEYTSDDPQYSSVRFDTQTVIRYLGFLFKEL